MKEKELRKLSRAELLEMLIEQMKENEKLREKLDSLNEELQSRKIKISKAGSLAEAALRLNGVFEAADNAAAQYIENIVEIVSKQKEECRRMQEKTQIQCAEMMKKTEEECASLLRTCYDEHPALCEKSERLFGKAKNEESENN